MKALFTKYGIILLLLFSGILLGFYSINKYRLTGDEMLTLNTATGLGHSHLINNTWAVSSIPLEKKVFTQNDYWARNTLPNVLENTASYNGNMVGYNMLLYYFIKLTYVDDGLLRGLSALFYVISILLVYFITKRLFLTIKAATICALFFALNPFVIQMGHDLRGYSFVTMMTLLASLVVLKIESNNLPNLRSKLGWSIILGLIYAISFLGHYFAAYIFVGHLLYACYRYITTKNNFLIQIGFALFICLLFFMLWWSNGGQSGLINMGIQDKYILRQSSAQTHTSLISLVMGTICFINSVCGYYFQYLGYKNSSFFYVLTIPVIAVAVAFFQTGITKEDKTRLAFLSILICSAIIFLQLCAIKSGHINSLVLSRFGAFVSPYFMILLGYALYRLLNSNTLSLKLFSILIISAHVLLNVMCYKIPFKGYWFTYYDVNGNVEKARSEAIPANPYSIIAKNIKDHYAPGDTVVYNNFNTSQNVNLYLRDAVLPINQTVNTLSKEDFRINTTPR